MFRFVTVGEKAERVAGWVIDDASRPQWAGQAVLRPLLLQTKVMLRRGWGLQEGGCSNDMHPGAAGGRRVPSLLSAVVSPPSV